MKQELQQQHVQREQHKRQQAKEQSQRIQNRQQQELDKSERIIDAKRQFRNQISHQNHQRYFEITCLFSSAYLSSEHKQSKSKRTIDYAINKINMLNEVMIASKHVDQTSKNLWNLQYVQEKAILPKT